MQNGDEVAGRILKRRKLLKNYKIYVKLNNDNADLLFEIVHDPKECTIITM